MIHFIWLISFRLVQIKVHLHMDLKGIYAFAAPLNVAQTEKISYILWKDHREPCSIFPYLFLFKILSFV
jgi:hypothetical protein